jgi:hypothetical protein
MGKINSLLSSSHPLLLSSSPPLILSSSHPLILSLTANCYYLRTLTLPKSHSATPTTLLTLALMSARLAPTVLSIT